jgi:capsular exopolysaccharide synthesis family protein
MEFLQLLDILLRRKWTFLAVFFFFFLAFAAGALLITPSYQAVAKLFIQSSNALSSLMTELGMPGSTMASTDEDVFETKTALAKVRPLLDDLINELKLKDRDGGTIKAEDLVDAALINKLLPQPAVKIKQEDDAAILKITATSPEAEQSAMIANRLAELYLDLNVQRAQAEFGKVKEFIKNKLTLLHADYSKALDNLTAFKVDENAEDLDTELSNTIARLNDLNTSYEDNEQLLALQDKEIASAKAQLNKVSKYRQETEEFSKDGEMTALKSKLNELLISFAAKSAVYQENHPEYKQLANELDKVKELISQTESITLNRKNLGIDPVYDSLSSKLVDLQISREVGQAKRALLLRMIAEYKKKLAAIPEKSARLAQLELSLSSSKDVYEAFLTYLRKVEVAEAIAMSDTRVVEPAQVPDKKKFPKKSIMLLAGLFLGLFWGTAAAFFFEYIDTAIQSPADLRHLDRFRLLGSIPFSRHLRGRRLISRLPPGSPLAEPYRSIRHSLGFASSGTAARTMLITSSGNGEGKSSLAANLALSCAAAGKKTLLIDLNLRQPVLHRSFALKNRQGLAEVVSGQATFKEALYPDAAPGLDILTAGRNIHDPGGIIDSAALLPLLRSCSQGYEAVLLDSPSLRAGSDALILSPAADLVICVLECGKTLLTEAEEAQQRIQQAGIKNNGWALNKCKQSRLSAAAARRHG